MITRFSSRRKSLDASFLNARLAGAKGYDRIAGYFSSSILEVAGEALEQMAGKIRMVCNSELDVRDIEIAVQANQPGAHSLTAANFAMRREWCASEPEVKVEAQAGFKRPGRDRFARLYGFLRSGKLEVRVLPEAKFGLVHGKAGVITLADGSRTSFMGSANETYKAWRMNYELVWEDDDAAAINWVQEEFDALWNSHLAIPLADFIIEDIQRCAKRTVISKLKEWVEAAEPEPAAAFIESPVYRKHFGLWEHQKYFIKLAFDAHQSPGGARFVLADMVGLGKTVQLALSGLLMALQGERPVLVVAPPPLLPQWQDELWALLGMPSARWTGKLWIDENGIEYPASGPESIRRCPRRIGLISHGLVTRRTDAAEMLKGLHYECVIVDEAHRARRRNLVGDRPDEPAEPNNLMRWLMEVSRRWAMPIAKMGSPFRAMV